MKRGAAKCSISFLVFSNAGICASIDITVTQEAEAVIIEINFNSDEAIYMQLTNQIIMGIATSRLKDGDALPSVRQLADTIRFN